MRKRRTHHDFCKADEELAALIERTDWSDVGARLLLYALEQLTGEGQYEERHVRAKSYAEDAVTQFFENQREFALIGEDKLFDCLCVIVNCLVRDDEEDARKRAERAAPALMDAGQRESLARKLWADGARHKS
ncbi:MAG TPA: hypothetical protein VF824_08915 [Thermoanaerobaculia bacterium]